MKKSQTSFEYIVLIAGVFMIVLIVLSFIYGFPSLISNTSKLSGKSFWRSQPLAIGALHLYDNKTEIYLMNNHRLPIYINEVYIDGIKLNITNKTTGYILPNKYSIYNSTLVYNKEKVHLSLNYTITPDSNKSSSISEEIYREYLDRTYEGEFK